MGGGVRSVELALPGFLHDVCSAIHPLGLGSPFFPELPLADHPVAGAVEVVERVDVVGLLGGEVGQAVREHLLPAGEEVADDRAVGRAAHEQPDGLGSLDSRPSSDHTHALTPRGQVPIWNRTSGLACARTLRPTPWKSMVRKSRSVFTNSGPKSSARRP